MERHDVRDLKTGEWFPCYSLTANEVWHLFVEPRLRKKHVVRFDGFDYQLLKGQLIVKKDGKEVLRQPWEEEENYERVMNSFKKDLKRKSSSL